MSTGFNADDILLMAEQIERNGAQFYRKAAGLPCDPDTKQILLNLAAMEDQHEKTFADMRAALTPDEKKPTAFDPEGEEATYLKLLADSNVFDPDANPADKLTGNESIEDILRIAIGLEKDSIVFYNGLKKFVPEGFGTDRVEDIIEEEFRHIATLSGKL